MSYQEAFEICHAETRTQAQLYITTKLGTFFNVTDVINPIMITSILPPLKKMNSSIKMKVTNALGSGLQGIGRIKSILCITCIKYTKKELTITIRFFVVLLRLDYRLGIFLS